VNEIVRALAPVVDALDALGRRYRVGGSVASSALGVPRSTIDVDIVCELFEEDVERFVSRLASAYYVDGDMIRDAIRRRASFNVVHLETMMKVDVFVTKSGAYDRIAFSRAVRKSLDESPRAYDLATAEDVVLRKLEWFRLGNEISERQWRDVLGVLQVQGDALDRAYLQHWAHELGLDDLLARALREAEGPEA
jgi:hypothetical protein